MRNWQTIVDGLVKVSSNSSRHCSHTFLLVAERYHRSEMIYCLLRNLKYQIRSGQKNLSFYWSRFFLGFRPSLADCWLISQVRIHPYKVCLIHAIIEKGTLRIIFIFLNFLPAIQVTVPVKLLCSRHSYEENSSWKLFKRKWWVTGPRWQNSIAGPFRRWIAYNLIFKSS